MHTAQREAAERDRGIDTACALSASSARLQDLESAGLNVKQARALLQKLKPGGDQDSMESLVHISCVAEIL